MFGVPIHKKIMLYANGFFKSVKERQENELPIKNAKDALDKFEKEHKLKK